MALWGEGSGLSIGGVFDGGIQPEGNGARLKLGIDLPVLPDIPLVNVKIPGFRDGGVIPGGRQYPAPRGVDHGKPTRATSALQSADQRREGVGLAPARPTRASNSSRPVRMASGGVMGPSGHEPAVAPRGHRVVVVSPRRAAHEISPGVPCPSCAAGITVPVR